MKMTDIENIIGVHEKLIYKIAQKFSPVPKEDLYQAGVIGIIKAYNNFVDNGVTKFTTYAYNYIFGEMYELRNSLRMIKLNKNILSLYKKLEIARETLAQKLGHLPSVSEMSEFLDIDEGTIYQVLLSTSSILSLDNENEEEKNMYEMIQDDKSEDCSNYIDLIDSMDTLSEEEKEIIKYRYFQDMTQSETAKILGMSQVKVSRTEKKSLNKMYNYLRV